MKKATHSLIAALFLFAGFCACEPYEDGPKISFQKKEDRIANLWKAELVLEEDRDVTAWYTDITWDFLEDGSIEIADSVEGDTSVNIQKGFWSLVENDEQIRLLYTAPAVYPDRSHWEITRLKEEELWVNDLNDTITRKIRFVPVNPK